MTKYSQKKPRIMSLDMFRGFAIFGMILVNYLGHFESMPDTFRHPRYGMTFANAIAPYFLFAVGMGLKLSLEKRIKINGARKAYWHAVKRYLILILIGVVVYGPDPVMDMWDALVDIGFAGLITLPFIASRKNTRLVGAIILLVLYQLLFTFTGYGEWTMPNSIDGGPLGPISWASILVFGTIQMDYLKEENRNSFMRKSLILAIPLLVIGLGLSYLQPKEIWEFSQRSMTVAYPIFASGLSMITFLAFYLVADVWKWKIPHLAVLGINPLVIYIIQQVLIAFYGNALPKTALWWQALLGFAVIYGICYLIARYLYRNKYVIKL
jgi:predicted acyltransferase